MLAKSFITVSAMTMISRVTGFAREILVAKYLGTGPLSEAFFVALKLPNFFRRLFAEGAFNAAFVPLFSSTLETEGKEAADRFSRNVMGLLIIALSVFTIMFLIFMPAAMFILAPGFLDNPELNELTIYLTRVTFPYLLLISVATAFAGVLNSANKFAVASFMPVYFNLILIFFITALAHFFPTRAHALAWGVFASGIIQLIWMAYFINKNNFSIIPDFKGWYKDSKINLFIKKFIPGALGAGIFQINLMVDVMIASFFTGAIAYLNYADRINQLPLSIIGTAMGTALLPELSRRLGAGDTQSANIGFNKAIEIVLLFSLPAACALFFIPHTIVGTLFERGVFTAADTHASALALSAFAFGLPAFTMNKIFSTSFFALKDTKTPVVGATISLFLNICLNILFALTFPRLGFMPHVGLALATSLSSWFSLWYLFRKLRVVQEELKFNDHMKSTTIKISLLSLFVSLIALLIANYTGYGFMPLAFNIGVIFIIYFSLAFNLKIISYQEIRKFVFRKK